MNVDTIWNRLTRFIVILLAISVLLLVGIWYLPLIRHNAIRFRLCGTTDG